MVVKETVKEAIWLRSLVEDFSLHQGVIIVFCDSQSAIHIWRSIRCIMKDHTHSVKYLFILEIKVIKVKKIDAADNLANMMTKLIPSRKFEHCLEVFGVHIDEGWAHRS